MSSLKAYVPSRALICALRQSKPRPCPLIRAVPAQFVRTKRTRGRPSDRPWREHGSKPLGSDQGHGQPGMRHMEDDETEKYRSYLDETLLMIDEAEKDPNYDATEINRRLIETISKEPDYPKDMPPDYQQMYNDMFTKSPEELKTWADNLIQEKKDEDARWEIETNNETRGALRELIEDPRLHDVKDVVQDLLDHWPEVGIPWTDEFRHAMDVAGERLLDHPGFNAKIEEVDIPLKEMEKSPEYQAEVKMVNKMQEMEMEIDRMSGQFEIEYGIPANGNLLSEEIDERLIKVRSILSKFPGHEEIIAEIDEVLAIDPYDVTEADLNRKPPKVEKIQWGVYPWPGTEDFIKQVKEEIKYDLTPEREEQLEEMINDPSFPQRLDKIQDLIKEAGGSNFHLATIATPSAPEPETLPESELVTVKEKLRIARTDPEHIRALQALKVRLPRPFNVSPVLKNFNAAMEFAYCGATDAIRRLLWRCYQKARTLPTFLQNLSDEAWDIIYYSQAVTWRTNKNRLKHLSMVLKDLESVGRNGPPTHPSTLQQDS